MFQLIRGDSLLGKLNRLSQCVSARGCMRISIVGCSLYVCMCVRAYMQVYKHNQRSELCVEV